MFSLEILKLTLLFSISFFFLSSRFLLNHPKAQPNAVETLDSDGDSPLFVVEDLETAKLLVEEFKADVGRKNNEGQTVSKISRISTLRSL